MRAFYFFPLLILLLASCYKKSEQIANMNTKIIDHDYAGGKWFDYHSAQIYTPDTGAPYRIVRFKVKDELHEGYYCWIRMFFENGDSSEVFYSKYFGYKTYDLEPVTDRSIEAGIRDYHSPALINVFSETYSYE